MEGKAEFNQFRKGISKLMRRKDGAEIGMELFLAGQISGMASKVNIKVLQEYLDTQPKGFNYGDKCRKILELAKVVQGEKPADGA